MPKHLKTAFDWTIGFALNNLAGAAIAAVGAGGVASGLSDALNAPTWAVASIGMSSAALIIAVLTRFKVRSVLPDQPTRADVKQWSSVKRLRLSEAACLWVGIEPHEQITDQRVRWALHRLREAIEDDELVRRRSPSELDVAEMIRSAGYTEGVSDNVQVDVVELARYADSTGQPRPAFLRDVDVPVDDSDRQHLSSSSQ